MGTPIRQSARIATIVAAVFATLTLAGCGGFGAEATPMPTRTPLPTFTPTPEGAQPPAQNETNPPADQGQPAAQPATEAVAQAQPTQAQPGGDSFGPGGETPAAGTPAAPPDGATAAPTTPPTAAPTAAAAELVTNDIVNIRRGPGTNYDLVGSAQAGTKFKITGKNQDGDWWQVDYNGEPGWIFGQLVNATGAQAVAMAQNIPAAPTPAPVPPTNTPAPAQPTPQPGPTQPPPTPKSNYKFNIVVTSACERQPAGNYVQGKTYIGGVPQSGYKVVFSYGKDAPPVTEPVVSGPHEGYPGWDQGYYSHIISANGARAGTWWVWVVDDAGNRISEAGSFTSTGPGEGCNQAIIDFDSR